jgi:hypothetical protein
VSQDFLHGENLRSLIGDSDACVVFPSWRCRFCRRWNTGAILVALVLVLQGTDHCSRYFSFT